MADKTLRDGKPRTALSPQGQLIDKHFRALSLQRRIYGILSLVAIIFVMVSTFLYADEVNAGKFWDRLPNLFDFVSYLAPKEPMEIIRAMFDIPSPYFDGSEQFNYIAERVPLFAGLYLPNYMYRVLVTINIAFVSTLIGFVLAFPLCFFASSNTMQSESVRFFVRRVMEVFRAFPEIVIAGFLGAIIAAGPIPAIFAVGLHTIGALGKLFFEVVENADMKPDEGLTAVGSNWVNRMRYGFVPDVLVNFLSYTLLRLEINVRASTIIGAVGGGGIGESLKISIGQGHGAKTIAIIILLFITVVLVDGLSGYLRKRLVGSETFAAH